MMATLRPDERFQKFALASIVVGIVAWAPLLLILVQADAGPPRAGEIQGLAAIGPTIMGLLMLGGGALIGTILAVLALRRPTRSLTAWLALGVNVIPLIAILGLAVFVSLAR